MNNQVGYNFYCNIGDNSQRVVWNLLSCDNESMSFRNSHLKSEGKTDEELIRESLIECVGLLRADLDNSIEANIAVHSRNDKVYKSVIDNVRDECSKNSGVKINFKLVTTFISNIKST